MIDSHTNQRWSLWDVVDAHWYQLPVPSHTYAQDTVYVAVVTESKDEADDIITGLETTGTVPVDSLEAREVVFTTRWPRTAKVDA